MMLNLKEAEKPEKPKYKLKTNWGKRNGTQYLTKIEKLHEKKVDPSYLGIKSPNTHIIAGWLKDGMERENLKEAEAQQREIEKQLQLEAEAKKKKLSVPVMLFRNRGMQHPDDMPEKPHVEIERLRKKMMKKHNEFYRLLREQKLFPFSNNYK